MSTFSDLIIDPDHMRAGNEDFLNNKTDTELKTLHKSAAKNDMKVDISRAKGWRLSSSSDMSNLDELVDNYYSELQRALMYKQLYYYYFQHQTGSESKQYAKMQDYNRRYETERAKFSSMSIVDEIEAVQTVRIIRS